MTLWGLLVVLAAVRSQCPHEAADLRPWSSAESWENGTVPTGGDVTIVRPILLDVAAAPMDVVTITAGGRLVFDPSAASLQLSAAAIQLVGGELWIGSENCPYTGKAEVILTGRTHHSEDAGRGQSAIVVGEGMLEMHGRPKLSWTRLADTVLKTTREELIGNAIYSVLDNERLPGAGFKMYEFDSYGNPIKNWGTVWSAGKYRDVMKNNGGVVLVVLSRWARFGPNETPKAVASAFEELCYNNTRASAMGQLADFETRAFAAICRVGSPALGVEVVGRPLGGRSQTGWLVQTINGKDFAAMSVVSLTGAESESQVEMASYSAGDVPSLVKTLTVLDDVSSWQAGDRIVLASTDYHYDQAEELEITACAACTSNQLAVMGPVWQSHWGEVTDGVDMRGEVGLLTRNVQLHGQTETKYFKDDMGKQFPADKFGGQIKILQNFTTARIEHVEIFHMGQQAVRGSYPIHFHMCMDTSLKGVYVRNNSIHDTFSRCIVIQGTHNVTVEDNFAANHLGHCYVLEDGGEQDNRLVGNLGLGTRAGTLLPTDKAGKVSTFWITNPDNELINNHAAGSDGIGIWILMPPLPIGLSATLDMGLTERQAMRTAVKAFYGNVAHSNKRFGFRLDGELHPNGTISPLVYTPLVDPTDPDSDPIRLRLHDITAYKNTGGVWLKSMWTLCTNFRLAENGIGMTFASSVPEDRGPHHEVLAASRIVGDTNNRGKPLGDITLESGIVIHMNRSVPRINARLAQIGIAFYRGPVHVVNTSFAGFKVNDIRPAGAIGKKFSNPYFSSPVSSVQNVTFDFVDPSQGSRFYDGDGTVVGFEERDGNRHSVVLDWDGSLTGYRRASVVRPIPLLLNARCVLMQDWGRGAAICPDRFSRLRLSTAAGLIPTFMTRNDLMSAEPETPLFEKQISYLLNTRESYILHFNTTVPEGVTMVPYGLQKGLQQLIGVCIGVNRKVSIRPTVYTPVESFEKLKFDNSNSKYFYDEAVGVIFFRFTSPFLRGENTTSNCPGDLDENLNGMCSQCVRIVLRGSSDDGDCRGRAYPAYQTAATSSEGALTVPVFN